MEKDNKCGDCRFFQAVYSAINSDESKGYCNYYLVMENGATTLPVSGIDNCQIVEANGTNGYEKRRGENDS